MSPNRAWEPFKQSERWLSALFENAADGIMIADAQTKRFCHCNPQICRMLGYSPEEIVSLGVADIHPPESLPHVVGQFQRQARKEISLAKDLPVRRKDGSVFFADVNSFPIELEGKEYLVGFFRDTTERKEANALVLRLRDEYQTIFDSSPTTIWYKDTKNNFIRVNRAAALAMGMSAERIEGRSASELFSGEAEKYYQDDLEVIESGKPKLGILERLVIPGGEGRWVLTDKVPYRDENGIVTGLIVFATDITDRVRMEDSLRDSEERYRGVVDNIGIGVSLIGPGLEILSLNRQMREWFPRIDVGIRPICYRSFNDPPRDEPCSYCPTIRTLRDGEVHESITETPTPTGIANYRVMASPIKDAAGKVVAAIEMVEDITARKQAETALRESEAKYRALVETTGTGYVILDDKGNVMDANPEYVRLTGHGSLGEIVGRSVVEWTADYEKQKNAAAVERCFKDGRTSNLEIDYVDRSGRVTPIEINATMMKIDDSMRIVTLCRDITDRRKAEATLREGEEMLRVLSRSAQDAIVMMDNNGDVSFWSAAAEKMFGFASGEILGRNLHETIGAPHHLPTHRAAFPTWQRTGEGGAVGKIVELTGRRKDGSLFPVELSLSSVKREDRWCAVAVIRDVTERKRTEAHIAHINAVLRGIRNVNQLITREKNRDRLISQACELMMEARGFHSAIIALVVDPGSRVFVKAGIGNVYQALKGMLDHGHLPNCAKTALETEGVVVRHIPAETCSGCPSSDCAAGRDTMAIRLAAGGKSYGAMIVSVPGGMVDDPEERGLFAEAAGDIAFALHGIESEAIRAAAEEALRQTEEQLRQTHKLDSIGRLAGGVAHDFNNLLTAIKGYADFMLRSLDPKSPERADAEEILKAADQAASLTQQLLAFSRKQVLRPVLLDINQAVKGMAKMLRRLIGEDIELSLSLDSRLGLVKADPGQMEQVILNLSVNARDAMPRGGELSISTTNFEPDSEFLKQHRDLRMGPHVLLSIRDTGTGMDAGVRSRIFEPFFTTKELGKGTGLGLSMVYGIIKQSGGEIEVHSEPGAGSRFEIYLPQVEKTEQDAATSATVVRSLAAGSETILFVEDDNRVRRLGTRILQAAGYTILEACDGAEALQLLEKSKRRVHLLLTDVVMPGMSGHELAQRVASLVPGIKVLYTSGYTDNIIAHHGVLEPGIELLLKPFTPELLAMRVRQLLDAD